MYLKKYKTKTLINSTKVKNSIVRRFSVINFLGDFVLQVFQWICSKTTLTGESRFHISTPWGLNPGPS
jgi:hypothetical protein